MPPKKNTASSASSDKKDDSVKLKVTSIKPDVLEHSLDISESDTQSDSDTEIVIANKKPVKIPETIKEDKVAAAKPSTKGKKTKTPTPPKTASDTDATSDDEIKIPSITKISINATTTPTTPLSSSTTIESAGEEDEGSAVGSWTNRLKNNLHEYKTIRDFLGFLKQNYNGMDEHSIADIWDKLSSISMDDMDKLYSKNKKREVKKKAKFQASGLPKPPRSGRDVFLKELTAKNKAADPPKKMSLKEQNDEWVKLDETIRNKYIEQVEKAKREYELAYQKQKLTAIQSGDYPEDAPKRPLNSYFRFRKDFLPLVKGSVPEPNYDDELAGKDDTEKRLIKTKLGKEYKKKVEDALKAKWDSLPAKKKDAYDAATAKDKATYDDALKAWRERTTARQNAKNEKTS